MKKILTDVDGVLLDWEIIFDNWMTKQGYEPVNYSDYKQSSRYEIPQDLADDLVKRFNESAWIGYLPVLRDAYNGVRKFVDAGYTFECITSLSNDRYASELRSQNLVNIFGHDAFSRIRCIGTGADKDDILAEYDSHFWIEDKPVNCLAGLKADHFPILIDHHYNQDFKNGHVFRAKNWDEIFDYVENN